MTLTVGILGGGQLARMMALAGAPLGLRFQVVDAAKDACASQVAPHLCADYTDLPAMEAFAKTVDVVTFDFENVPAATASYLAARVPVFPNPRALAVAQDRIEEKQLFKRLGLVTAAFAAVDSREDLDAAAREIGPPALEGPAGQRIPDRTRGLRVEGEEDAAILSAYLARTYVSSNERASELLVPMDFEDRELLEESLSNTRVERSSGPSAMATLCQDSRNNAAQSRAF